MASDELNAPLGQDKAQAAVEAAGGRPATAGRARSGCSAIVVVAWAIFVNDPLGGEPIAVVATGPLGQEASGQAGRRRPAAGPLMTGPCRQRAGVNVAIPAQVAAAAGQQDHHHHRRLQRQASGGDHSRQAGSDAAPKAPVDQASSRNHAPRRHPEDRAGRRAAVPRSTPIRASCRPTRPTRRASPSSSAGSASAPPAPPTPWRSCRRR